MNKEIKQRVALVTGGSSGFGQAIARRMAKDGYAVVVADLRPSEQTEAMVKAEGAPFLFVKTDITSKEEVQALYESAVRELGGVDILIANAGIYPIVPFFETTWEKWRHVMAVNIDSMYLLFQTFIPGMVERRWGRVIAMTSGSFYMPPPNFAAYIASKGAVIGLVRGVSAEVGQAGVTVNSVAPPLAETPGVAAGPQRALGVFDFMINVQAIKREGRAEDVTGMVSFLASDDAAFVTGQTLPVDGGAIHL